MIEKRCGRNPSAEDCFDFDRSLDTEMIIQPFGRNLYPDREAILFG